MLSVFYVNILYARKKNCFEINQYYKKNETIVLVNINVCACTCTKEKKNLKEREREREKKLVNERNKREKCKHHNIVGLAKFKTLK